MFTCRECENEINQATELCPHCGADLTGPAPGSEPGKGKPALGKILLRWGVLLGVLLAAIWSFLWFVVPERQGNPTTQAEARAAASLRDVRGALLDFASAQGGAYPQQFEALGERVRLAARVARASTTRSSTRRARSMPTGAFARSRCRRAPEIMGSGIFIWMTAGSCARPAKTALPRRKTRPTEPRVRRKCATNDDSKASRVAFSRV